MIDYGLDMDAHKILTEYVNEHLHPYDTHKEVKYDTFCVWKVRVLQNWKYLMSTSLPDGMYYELTFNGDKNEWYIDAYKLFDHKSVSGSSEHYRA